MTNRTVATLLAAVLLIGTVSPVAAAGAVGGASNAEAQDQTEAGGSVNVTVGQQLSTVMVATDGDVRHEVDETTFELRFEGSDDDERAAAVAERAEELARRAIAIREDYDDATRAHEAGEISDSEYAARIAALNARAEDVAESVRRLRGRAAGVSAFELRAEGFTAADLRAIDERLDAVTGPGAAALLQRFTGRAEGEIRIETRDGLSIEVEGEDGEVSREIERPRDDSTNITLAQVDALETARAELGSPPEGGWTLEKASVHDDSGYYEFEFVLTGANATGEAEVRVDGSSGDVFRLETEIEAPDDGDDDEREDDEEDRDRDRDDADGDHERDRDELALLVAHGTPGPSETVTLLALSRGEPVAGASVTMNGEHVGTTGDDGTLIVTLPDDEAHLLVESGDAEGELEFEFDQAEREDRELRRHFRATATVKDGTVTIALTYDGSPVEGATVYVGDREVGTTSAHGTVAFDAAGRDDLDVAVRKGAFGADLEFERRDGSLTLVEVEFEDVDEDRAEDDRDESDDGEHDAGDDRETEEEPETEDGHETETDDHDETETPRDTEVDGELAIHVVDGAREPGATVTVEVTVDGSPVPDAAVLLNDEHVGTTDDHGRVTVTLPADSRVEIVAEYGDEDAEVEFDLGGGDGHDDDGR